MTAIYKGIETEYFTYGGEYEVLYEFIYNVIALVGDDGLRHLALNSSLEFCE